MSDELVKVNNLSELKEISKTLSQSALLPVALRKKPEDVFVTVLTGAELGLSPMQACRSINVINGKASLSSDLMVALVKKSPECEYFEKVESTAAKATYKTKRKGEGETVMSFTIEQAKTAGLNGDNWRKYPDAMLRARCKAFLARDVYPDVVNGLYDSDSEEIPQVKDVTPAPQKEHVADLSNAIKSQIEDGEIVSEAHPMLARIQAIKTEPELAELVPELQALPEGERDALRPAFMEQFEKVKGVR